MRYLRNYNNDEMINESRWFELAIMRSEYNRDAELREFFLELVDLGGKIFGIKNSTHTIVDENFELKNRIHYTNKPLYRAYTLRLRFVELSTNISRSVDDQMNGSVNFFGELSESLSKFQDFGYKFKIKKMVFDPGNSSNDIMFDIIMYHNEDIIPWEHIFAPYEKV